MQASTMNEQHWTNLPILQVSDGSHKDEYRLRQGRIEMRHAGASDWQSVPLADLHKHLEIERAVGKWLARLYASANVASILLN